MPKKQGEKPKPWPKPGNDDGTKPVSWKNWKPIQLRSCLGNYYFKFLLKIFFLLCENTCKNLNLMLKKDAVLWNTPLIFFFAMEYMISDFQNIEIFQKKHCTCNQKTGVSFYFIIWCQAKECQKSKKKLEVWSKTAGCWLILFFLAHLTKEYGKISFIFLSCCTTMHQSKSKLFFLNLFSLFFFDIFFYWVEHVCRKPNPQKRFFFGSISLYFFGHPKHIVNGMIFSKQTKKWFLILCSWHLKQSYP